MTRPAREAITVILTATATGVAAGALVCAAWLSIQLAHLICALAVLAEALASTS